MISRPQWDQLSDEQKFVHLLRQSQWAEQAIHTLGEAIDRLREQLPKQGGKAPSQPPDDAA